jgi:hypothetical protein
MISRAIPLSLAVLSSAAAVHAAEQQTPIDRHAVVSRHNVTLTSFGVEVPRNKQSALQLCARAAAADRLRGQQLLTTCNLTVELSYWFYGLRTAQLWRERLGLPREPKWDEILAKLSKPPVVEGLCVDAENAALGHRPDGRRLGGRPRQTRPRFPRRRQLDGEVRRFEKGVVRKARWDLQGTGV